MRHIYFFYIALFITIFSVTLNAEIRAVGSSTVYPFITIAAEQFKRGNKYAAVPVIESTGSGAGFKIFCSAIGTNSVDITNSSRQIKSSEIAVCNKNKIVDILEIKIGYDAISIIHNNSLGKVSLSRTQLFLALAKQVPTANGKLINNPYEIWGDLIEDKNTHLYDIPIKVMGPPVSSGTREVFIDLVMKPACDGIIKEHNLQLNKTQKERFCHSIRTDGAWINGGENDALLVNKTKQMKDMFAILGYSYYAENSSFVGAVLVEGIAPTKQNIDKKIYPLFRPLFVYVKGEHIQFKPELLDFIKELVSEKSLGTEGYLIKKGLIPTTKKDLEDIQDRLSQY